MNSLQAHVLESGFPKVAVRELTYRSEFTQVFCNEVTLEKTAVNKVELSHISTTHATSHSVSPAYYVVTRVALTNFSHQNCQTSKILCFTYFLPQILYYGITGQTEMTA